MRLPNAIQIMAIVFEKLIEFKLFEIIRPVGVALALAKARSLVKNETLHLFNSKIKACLIQLK